MREKKRKRKREREIKRVRERDIYRKRERKRGKEISDYKYLFISPKMGMAEREAKERISLSKRICCIIFN